MVFSFFQGRLDRRMLCALLAGALLVSCGRSGTATDLPPEPWADHPVSEWPDFVLSSDVVFSDTTFSYLANAVAVDTGLDTVGATVKHLFMVFRNQRGTETIDLGEDFEAWSFRSSRDSTLVLRAERLINADRNEPISDFSGLKDRDWLLFELGAWVEGVYPLKVRYAPLERGEVVYAVGRSLEERRDPDPVLSPLRVYRAASTYYYVQPLDDTIDPRGTSGSPVIDENGYLVGLVSGGVGRLGVVAGVEYMRQQFDRYGVAYRVGG
jgi:hypothetical protein